MSYRYNSEQKKRNTLIKCQCRDPEELVHESQVPEIAIDRSITKNLFVSANRVLIGQ